MAMSLKPLKKGDWKKSWLKPRRDTPVKNELYVFIFPMI